VEPAQPIEIVGHVSIGGQIGLFEPFDRLVILAAVEILQSLGGITFSLHPDLDGKYAYQADQEQDDKICFLHRVAPHQNLKIIEMMWSSLMISWLLRRNT